MPHRDRVVYTVTETTHTMSRNSNDKKRGGGGQLHPLPPLDQPLREDIGSPRLLVNLNLPTFIRQSDSTGDSTGDNHSIMYRLLTKRI